LNYNAGSGCLSRAIRQTVTNQQPLTWANVLQYLEPVCQAGIAYVDDISNMPVSGEPGVGSLLATPNPEVVLTTPTPVSTLRSTITPTSIYPSPTPPEYPVITSTPLPDYP